MEILKKITGFADAWDENSAAFTKMEEIAREVFSRYLYNEIRIPIVEFTTLFQRSIGDTTDVVQKEMFTFPDRHGCLITLRPEATAGIMRACIEAGKDRAGQLEKLFTIGPMFRYERPQKGRLRQFHQINCECLGSDSPYIDAEIICMLWEFLRNLQIPDLKLKINSLGCNECRPKFRERLISFLRGVNYEALCDDCKSRMNTNPMRILDCKKENCKEILLNSPKITESICENCEVHFKRVLETLEKQKIPYELDPNLVRGLDYYMRTTFEVISENIGAQSAVAGGGRYDGLIASLGGKDIPGIGFACGMERLILLLKDKIKKNPDFYLVCPETEYVQKAFSLMEILRKANISGEMNYQSGSFKSLMRQASKKEAKFCLILGENEIRNNLISVKNMETGHQDTVHQNELVEWLLKVLYK